MTAPNRPWAPRRAGALTLQPLPGALPLLLAACALTLVSALARLVKGTGELLANRDAFAGKLTLGSRLLHPFVRTLSTIAISPDVAVHSIVAVLGKGPVDAGEDGVVRCESAHLASHSVRGHPAAIEEVRRILLPHLAVR